MAWPRRCAVVVAVLFSLLVAPVPAAIRAGAQESTSTTGPRLTTTSVVQDDGDGDGGLSTGNKVVFLIIGLVVLALVLIVITWRYWRATRPVRAPAPVVPSPAPPSSPRKTPTV